MWAKHIDEFFHSLVPINKNKMNYLSTFFISYLNYVQNLYNENPKTGILGSRKLHFERCEFFFFKNLDKFSFEFFQNSNAQFKRKILHYYVFQISMLEFHFNDLKGKRTYMVQFYHFSEVPIPSFIWYMTW